MKKGDLAIKVVAEVAKVAARPLATIGWTHRKRGTEGVYRRLAVRFVVAKMTERSCKYRVGTHAS